MFIRFASAALAAALLTGAVAGDAYADHRKRHGVIVYDRFYDGPVFLRRPGFLRLMFGGYGMSRDDYEELYGDDRFDESYYDPRFDEPQVKPKPRKITKSTAKPQTTVPAGKSLTTATLSKPAATEATAAAPAGGLVTCGKASEIIAGYGFSAVKSSDCTGEVFAFNATRDGKPFSIKLNAASGELTEVKKLQ